MTPKQKSYFKGVNDILANTDEFTSPVDLFNLGLANRQQLVTGRCDSLVRKGLMEVKYKQKGLKSTKTYKRLVAELTLHDYEQSIVRDRRGHYNMKDSVTEVTQKQGIYTHNSDKAYTPEYLAWAKQERKQRKSARIQANSCDYGAF
jgi:hypothetical protein